MKSFILLPFAFIMNVWPGELLAQTKMTLTLDGKESDVLGYSFEPSTGISKEISIFGPMQNAATTLEMDFLAGKRIPVISIRITEANTETITINLMGVSILAFKQHISTYSNGSFTVSPGGNMNIEIKCKFENTGIQYSLSEKVNDKSGTPGINTSNNTNDSTNNKKWEIKANPSLKGATGRLLLNLPADAECFIYIYAYGDKKQLYGTSKDRVFSLMPGLYDILISSASLQEVAIQKGMDTRIRAGILNISSSTAWELYDETGKVRITGASKASKIGLPVGNYQLKMAGAFQSVMIKDEETAEY